MRRRWSVFIALLLLGTVTEVCAEQMTLPPRGSGAFSIKADHARSVLFEAAITAKELKSVCRVASSGPAREECLSITQTNAPAPRGNAVVPKTLTIGRLGGTRFTPKDGEISLSLTNLTERPLDLQITVK